jgi:AcrR family transcriptional regulator
MTREERERQTRKEGIIDAAEKLFREKGFDNSTMDEIADAAEFTKRTVYSYFINKEDLYFAVALRITRYYVSVMLRESGAIKSCAEKIEEAGKSYFMFFQNDPGGFKIISFARTIHNFEKESPHHAEMVKESEKIFEFLAGVIKQGQSEGSVRKDIDPLMTAYYLAASIVSILEMFSVNRPESELFGVNGEKFLEFYFSMILDSIKPAKIL